MIYGVPWLICRGVPPHSSLSVLPSLQSNTGLELCWLRYARQAHAPPSMAPPCWLAEMFFPLLAVLVLPRVNFFLLLPASPLTSMKCNSFSRRDPYLAAQLEATKRDSMRSLQTDERRRFDRLGYSSGDLGGGGGGRRSSGDSGGRSRAAEGSRGGGGGSSSREDSQRRASSNGRSNFDREARGGGGGGSRRSGSAEDRRSSPPARSSSTRRMQVKVSRRFAFVGFAKGWGTGSRDGIVPDLCVIRHNTRVLFAARKGSGRGGQGEGKEGEGKGAR